MKCFIIDPIMRGSRLFVSAVASQAFATGVDEVIVVTRKDFRASVAENKQFLAVKFEAVIHFPEDVWFGRVPIEGVKDTIKYLECNVSPGDVVFFTGYNEYFPFVTFRLLMRRKAFLNVSFGFVDYTSNHYLRCKHWFGVEKILKVYGKLFLTSLLCVSFRKTQILVMDERISGVERGWCANVLKIPLRYLEDPHPDVSKPVERAIEASYTFLLVGRQTRRKGLEDVIVALEDLALRRLDTVQVRLVGQLVPEMEVYRERLEALPVSLFSWIDDYLSEEQIINEYRKTDFVILPYTSSFTGSSGVFAYSSACGKPVIATDHGCIGYRVAHFDCGYTYPAGTPSALVDAIVECSRLKGGDYQLMSDSMSEYAERTSVRAFSNTIDAVVSEWKK